MQYSPGRRGSNDLDSVSEQSLNTVERKKRNGLKKLGSGLKNAFGGKKRRRRKKGSDGQSYDSYSVRSEDSSSPKTTTRRSPQQEWVSGGANGLAEMAAISDSRTNRVGGRGLSLSKIAEEHPDEDEDDEDFRVGDGRRQKRSSPRKGKSRASPGSVSSRDSKNKRSSPMGSLFGRKQKQTVPSDPLSLVVLLVEPSSLRFELLSLDFDLSATTTTKKSSRRSRQKRGGSEDSNSDHSPQALHLTVRDVLDQITPEALTDETLKQRAAIPGSCTGLIDRTGTVHFGGASLEVACSKRPLRAFDAALLKQKQTDTNSDKVLLSVPTYSGEPHKDVLLGFFGNSHQTDDVASGMVGEDTEEDVANTLELARPIFADPNVVGLMENNGYDLTGWKVVPKPQPTKLGKPLPPPPRHTSLQSRSPLIKLVLGLLAAILATILAWSLVAGGLHFLPSIADGPTSLEGTLDKDYDDPTTLEGYVVWAYQAAKVWYYSNESSTDQTQASGTYSYGPPAVASE